MSITQDVKNILSQTLQLGDRSAALELDSPLLGAVPELDSMAVVSILTSMEDYFGFVIGDDEISADTFTTLASLVEFAERKLEA